LATGVPIGVEGIRLRRVPKATILLIIVNIIIFFITNVSPSTLVPYALTPDDVYQELGAVPIAIVRGERLWTLFTSIFLHGDLYHLIGNMLFLYFFGLYVENAMGSGRYLLFYVISGLAAHLFHILSIMAIPREWLLTNYGYTPWIVPAIGASGAISGVMGAYLIYYPHSRLTLVYFFVFLPLFIPLPAWMYILFWFITQLALGLLVLAGYTYSSIAFWAHIGGFIAGVALAQFFLDPRIKKYIMYKLLLEEQGFIIEPYGYEYD